MKISIFFLIVIMLAISSGVFPVFGQDKIRPDISHAYTELQEAYRAKEEGDENLAEEKIARALYLFRQAAAGNVSGLINPETEIILEETPRAINLIENKILLKIEFKTGGTSTRSSRQEEIAQKQQQLILQKLILLTRENEKVKKILSRIMKDTEIIDNIEGSVSEMESNIDQIDDIDGTLDDVDDTTDDISDTVDDIESETDDIAQDISDIAQELDILQEILQIVEDIKDDKDRINEVQDAVDELKDSVESQAQ